MQIYCKQAFMSHTMQIYREKDRDRERGSDFDLRAFLVLCKKAAYLNVST
jgi:hypothetical protein